MRQQEGINLSQTQAWPMLQRARVKGLATLNPAQAHSVQVIQARCCQHTHINQERFSPRIALDGLIARRDSQQRRSIASDVLLALRSVIRVRGERSLAAVTA